MRRSAGAAWFVTLLVIPLCGTAALWRPDSRAQQSRAVTIVNGRIADGSGAPLRRGNVRIEGDRIVSIGAVKPADGDAVIDAGGLAVAPGFIDIHNHSTEGLAGRPAAESQVAQGITTVVVGADGSSPWPIARSIVMFSAPPTSSSAFLTLAGSS